MRGLYPPQSKAEMLTSDSRRLERAEKLKCSPCRRLSSLLQGALDLLLVGVQGVESHVGLRLFVGPLAHLVEVIRLEHGGYDVPDLLPRELEFAAFVEISDA